MAVESVRNHQLSWATRIKYKIGYYKPSVEALSQDGPKVGVTRSFFGYGPIVPLLVWGGGVTHKTQIEIPEMIAVPCTPSKITKGEIPVGLFKQVMQGYEITGDDAGKLRAMLADPKRENDALIHASLFDAREFAKRLSDLTGRKFRVPTRYEWAAVCNKLDARDKGRKEYWDHWTWTETQSKDHPGRYVLCRLDVQFRSDTRDTAYFPEARFGNFAIRLVEDK